MTVNNYDYTDRHIHVIHNQTHTSGHEAQSQVSVHFLVA